MLQALNQDNGLKQAQYSYALMEVASGKMIESAQPNQLLTPASTAKMLTAACALYELGADYTTQTQFFLIGEKKKSTFYGTLVIKGGGDPGFSYAQAKSVVDTLLKEFRHLKCDKLDGKIVIDPYFFDYNEKLIAPGYTWEDIGNYYAAPISGFSVEQNQFSIKFEKGSEGQKARIKSINPMLVEKVFPIESVVKYGPSDSGDQSWIFSAPLQNKIWINGTVPAGKTEFEIKGALPDPAPFYGVMLKTELQAQGITVEGEIEIAHFDSQGKLPFLAIPSSPLSEWIKEVNQNSFNFYADNILCHLGRKINKPNVSGGTEVVKKYVAEVLKYTDELSIRDGSGLSPTNAQTVEFQAKLLTALAQNSAFRASLAVSGTTGTFKNAFPQPELKGMLAGKSGSLSGVLGYSFYFKAKSGKEFAFSLLINHHFSRPTDIREKLVKQLMVWMKEL